MQTQQSIPLNKLFLSPLNTRQSQEGDDVSDLLPLIRSQGLLQRLVVVPPAGREKRFGVVAGGRRLLCLNTLAAQGEIGKRAEVDCLVIPAETGIAASIAENTARKNLHPADEFLAFRVLVEAGTPIEDVAATFGVTPLVVQRRLKLSTVSPRLLDEYRRDEITLDQIMALALTDDHAAQEAAWFEVPDWDRQPHALRRKLTEGEPDSASDRRVAFVGIDTYRDAGGALRQDLFADNAGYILDVPLLDRLVREKMQAQAEGMRADGWGTVHAVSNAQGFNLNFECVRLRPAMREAIESELVEQEATEARIRAIDATLDADEDQEGVDYEALSDEREVLEGKLDDLHTQRQAWTSEQKAQAGAVLSLDAQGNLRCDLGVVPRLAETHLDGGGVTTSVIGQRPRPERAAHSERLVAQLTAHRSAALMATLADNPHAALAALLATMVPKVFGFGVAEAGLCITVSPSTASLKQKADDLVDSRALHRLADLHAEWNAQLSVTSVEPEEDEPDRDPTIDWLLAQDTGTLLRLLAYCVSATVDLTVTRESTRKAAAFTRAVGLNMADWWTATARSYFGHVAKTRILVVVNEACANPPSGLSVLKKDALAGAAEQAVAGTRWLPEFLR